MLTLGPYYNWVMTAQPTPDQLAFIEQFTALNVTIGVPKSTMRLLAYLIICEDPDKTAEDIMSALDMSAGSVSASLSMLVEAGLVERVKQKGVRRPTYRVHPEGWNRAVDLRIKSIHAMALFTDDAYNAHPHNQRLADMRDTYVRFDEHLKKLPKK